MKANVIDLSTRVEFAGASATGEEKPATAEHALRQDLRRARRRIAQLERNLLAAMRDSLGHYRRAEEAERRLRDIGG